MDAANLKRPKEGWRSAISTVAVLLIAPIFAFILISFVFQSYVVDGPSMETTLQNNDRLIVWKVPRTWAKITGNAYIPKRGDIVVFNEPNLSDYGQNPKKQLIKRVIALPGERVVVKSGKLMVFNSDSPQGFQPDELLSYGKDIANTPGELDVTVGEGQIFLSGDNRENSLDSRAFGPVDADNIAGKLVVRVFPFDKAQKF